MRLRARSTTKRLRLSEAYGLALPVTYFHSLTKVQLFGNTYGNAGPKRDLQSVLPELESAITNLENEIKRLDEEEAVLRQSLNQTVGSMSDLRYGRLANSQLPEQVLESLSDLHETCKRRG